MLFHNQKDVHQFLFQTQNFEYINLFENDFLLIFPELFLLSSTIILLVYGVVFSTSSEYNYPSLNRNVACLGFLVLVCTLFLVLNNPVRNGVFFYNALIIDELSFFLKVLTLLSACCVFLLSFDYIKDENVNTFEYKILILLSTASMLLMISSYDFISMYLAIEFQTLCFYVLAASKRTSPFSTEAGLKYFILGAFSSGIILFGISIIYGMTGAINFEDVSKVLTGLGTSQFVNIEMAALTLGIAFLFAGFMFKLTAAPFHMWSPDVYEGSPFSVTAFFLITPKIAILGLFLRVFFFCFFDFLLHIQSLIALSCFLSLVVGSFGALSQIKLKRLFAYSSIGHVGYILLGCACGTVEGMQSVLLYLIVYVITTINIFAVLLSLRQPSNIHIKYIYDLGMLAKTNPLLALTLTASLFSLAGIPPLAGFFSKFYLFFSALGSGLYFLAIAGVMSSVVSCFYYIRVIKTMYFETPEQWLVYKQVDKEKALLLALTSFFLIFFSLYPNPLFLLTSQIALDMSQSTLPLL